MAFVILPVATQRSVDYLGTQDFAMRPRRWLEIMSANGTTSTSAPPFGYDLAAMRLRPSDAEKLDLSAIRVACVGAEMINPAPLEKFARALAPAGFNPKAFLPCYGMAECALAISFVGLDEEVRTDCVDAQQMQEKGVAVAVDPEDAARSGLRVARYVDCGAPLPSFEISIRDEAGTPLPERRAGVVHLRGPSVMSGYFGDFQNTSETLSSDGWLNTGDVGYLAQGRLFITGRKKDMIIIHGRNIWPEDLEHLAKAQPGVHYTDVAAFSVPSDEEDGQEMAVLVVQCRERDEVERARLAKTIKGLVRSEFGIDCIVELVPPRTLPRTSSGTRRRHRRVGFRRAGPDRAAAGCGATGAGAGASPAPAHRAPGARDRQRRAWR